MQTTKAMKSCSICMSISTAVAFLAYISLRTLVSFECPSPELLETFEPNRYTGVWYELRRSTNIPFETGECVTAQYSQKANGRIKVDNQQYYGYYEDGSDTKQGGEGEAWINNWNPGMLFVTFFFDFGGRYRILDTDYDNYVVVYSCENALANALLLTEYSWVLVRD